MALSDAILRQIEWQFSASERARVIDTLEWCSRRLPGLTAEQTEAMQGQLLILSGNQIGLLNEYAGHIVADPAGFNAISAGEVVNPTVQPLIDDLNKPIGLVDHLNEQAGQDPVALLNHLIGAVIFALIALGALLNYLFPIK